MFNKEAAAFLSKHQNTPIFLWLNFHVMNVTLWSLFFCIQMSLMLPRLQLSFVVTGYIWWLSFIHLIEVKGILQKFFNFPDPEVTTNPNIQWRTMGGIQCLALPIVLSAQALKLASWDSSPSSPLVHCSGGSPDCPKPNFFWGGMGAGREKTCSTSGSPYTGLGESHPYF